jgi:nucleoside-diphosphate-sugar epimerase
VICLVTGGAGFIGSHLVRELLARGHHVRVLDNPATGRRENLDAVREEIRFIHGSTTDPEAAAEAVRGCHAVFHQAAIPSVSRSLADPVGTNEANVTGTLVMLDEARKAGVRRFIYAASSSAYGDNPELPKREEMTPLPRSPYAVAKLAGEQYVRVYGRLFPDEMETVSLRYFNVFGPRQDPNSRYAAVVPAFIQAMLEDRPVHLDGDGTQSRDFTFVENVVQANLLAMEARGVSGEMFNVACGQRYDLNCLLRELSQILGTEPRVERQPPRQGDVPHSLADISRARRLLNYEPRVDFSEGLCRTVAWLRDEGAGCLSALTTG